MERALYNLGKAYPDYGSNITIDDVKDVDCIMEFAKTMDIVNRLIRNDKIKYIISARN